MEAREWGHRRDHREVFCAGWSLTCGKGRRERGQGWLLKGCRSHIKELGLF